MVFEVVTLACGLVGGDTLHRVLSSRLSSVTMVLAALTGNELCFMRALLGSVPRRYPTIQYYAACFVVKYPEHKMLLKRVVGEDVRFPGDSSKLVELGFRFKYSMEETLDCHRIRRMRQENGRTLMVIIK
ncbi:Anthocyanidin reductase [Hordeum vulgare]|nr:Anthocyanidin reductase [Hordeum vulgare]